MIKKILATPIIILLVLLYSFFTWAGDVNWDIGEYFEDLNNKLINKINAQQK